MSERELELKKEMKSLYLEYSKAEDMLINRIASMEMEREKFPSRMSDAESSLEDLILSAARHKHDAISLTRDSISISESMNIDCDYFCSQIKLFMAESFLKEHGFDKTTESLRDAYVSSNQELRQIMKLMGRVKAIANVSEKLVRAFESDETNYRKLMERQTKLTGL